MRARAFALLLLACPGLAAAAETPPEEEAVFLYNVAIFEFNAKRPAVSWKDFGQPQPLTDEVHSKNAKGSIDTHALRKLDVLRVAKHLQASGAGLVANVPAAPAMSSVRRAALAPMSRSTSPRPQ